jgi:hypothetical protein
MTDTTNIAPRAAPDQPAVLTTDWKARRGSGSAGEGELAAAKRLTELEEASKSDLQKAIDRAEAAERRIAEVELSAARTEIASVGRGAGGALRGSTREELEAHAAELTRGSRCSRAGSPWPGRHQPWGNTSQRRK